MVSTRVPRLRHRRAVPRTQESPACLASPRCSSNTTSTSSSDSSICAKLQPSFRCLEQLSLDVQVEEEKSKTNPTKTDAVFYVLHVHPATCDVATWSYRKRLNEYVAFQQQLLPLLQQGHVCAGDCPWLYSFVQHYFPKKDSTCPFKRLCPKLMTKRRDALQHCMTTLLGFLRTRENQRCSILSSKVLPAVTAFVYGELGSSDHPLLRNLTSEVAAATTSDDEETTHVVVTDEDVANVLTPSSTVSATSSSSTLSSSGSSSFESTSSGAKNATSTATTAAPLCPLCRNRLDEDATTIVAFEQLTLSSTTTTASSSSSTTSIARTGSSNSSRGRHSARLYHYATTLQCGHAFHDECILQYLNEELRCPVCGHCEAKTQ